MDMHTIGKRYPFALKLAEELHTAERGELTPWLVLDYMINTYDLNKDMEYSPVELVLNTGKLLDTAERLIIKDYLDVFRPSAAPATAWQLVFTDPFTDRESEFTLYDRELTQAQAREHGIDMIRRSGELPHDSTGLR